MNQRARRHASDAITKKNRAGPSQLMIASPAAWRKFVQSNWSTLKRQADQSTLASPYQKLVMMVFTPVMPNPSTKLTLLRRLLKKFRYCAPLSKRLTEIYRDRNYNRTAEELAGDELLPERLNADELVGLDWLIVATGGLDGSANQGQRAIQFARNLLEAMREYGDYPSAVRVQAGDHLGGGACHIRRARCQYCRRALSRQQIGAQKLSCRGAHRVEHTHHGHSSRLAASYTRHVTPTVHTR